MAPDHGSDSRPTLFTIGHSNHSAEAFVALLQQNGIEVLVDTRSQPYSRFLAHFNRGQLDADLRQRGIKYLFMGDQLGGRPTGDEYYDEKGHVRYDRLSQSPEFLEGLARLQKGLTQFRVAIMCSEENPLECHRYLLIARVLRDRGVKVLHVRGNGSVQDDRDLEQTESLSRRSLFDCLEEPSWVSPQPIQRKRA